MGRIVFCIYRKEVAAYLSGLTGLFAAGFFLLLSGLLLWVFPDTSIIAYGEASLDSFFNLAPYLLMFLAPAVTMQSVVGEKRTGTFEWLLTRPVTLSAFLAGKFLSGVTVIFITLVPTLLYYYSVYRLGVSAGNVDTGAVAGSYLGLLLLGAVFIAVGIFASSVARSVVVAFLTGVFICFFLYTGFASLGGMTLWGQTAYVISWLSIHEHYQAISRGVLDLRDITYFLSAIALFLLMARMLLWSGNRSFPKGNAIGFLTALIWIILVNMLSALFPFRFDFTAEKRYTLSPVSRQAVQMLDGDLHVTVFLAGDLPAGFRRLHKATADLLRDLRSYAPRMVTFSFTDPLEGSREEQETQMEMLAAKGISATNLQVNTQAGFTQKLIVPAALITYKGNQIAVDLLQGRIGTQPEEVLGNSIQNLEYAFVSAIRKIAQGGKPLIGFTEGHGELTDTELYDLMSSLSHAYQVGRLHMGTVTFETLRNLSVLIVPKPTEPFSETEKFKLDYFVQHGGSIVWAIDQVRAELDSMRLTGEQLVTANRLNLDDLLFKYGLRFNYHLIADMNCTPVPLTAGATGNSDIQLAPWPYHPLWMPLSGHPIVKGLDGILAEYAGTLDTIGIPNVKKEVLLRSSSHSRITQLPALISFGQVEEMLNEMKEPRPAMTVAALLEGDFPSVFAGRPVPAGIPDSLAMPERPVTARMLAIADGDVLKNQVGQGDHSPFPLGWDQYTQRHYGNKTFLLNAIDYLAGQEETIALREKEVKLRLLDQMKIQKTKLTWQLLNVVLPPVLLIITGLIQQWIRRKKYGTDYTG